MSLTSNSSSDTAPSTRSRSPSRPDADWVYPPTWEAKDFYKRTQRKAMKDALETVTQTIKDAKKLKQNQAAAKRNRATAQARAANDRVFALSRAEAARRKEKREKNDIERVRVEVHEKRMKKLGSEREEARNRRRQAEKERIRSARRRAEADQRRTTATRRRRERNNIETMRDEVHKQKMQQLRSKLNEARNRGTKPTFRFTKRIRSTDAETKNAIQAGVRERERQLANDSPTPLQYARPHVLEVETDPPPSSYPLRLDYRGHLVH